MRREYINRGWSYYKNLEEDTFTIVNIPHTNIELPFNYLNEKDYQFTSIYKKKVFIKKEELVKHIFLTFEGIGHVSTVYVNKQEVGKHFCGYDSFRFDIYPYVIFDSENLIEIKVESSEELNVPPFGNVIDYLTYGGMYRDVYLDYCLDDYIEDIFIKPINNQGNWSIEVEITSSMNNKKTYDLEISFNDEVIINKSLISTSSFDVINITFDNPKLWDIDSPNLYCLKLTLNKMEIKEEKFGLRTCVFKEDGFYLNDKKIKIRGLNRHQSFPYVGYAMPKSMQEEDARILKEELKVNAVRTSHYPQSHYFISKCDELGLLVFTEMVGWQHIGDEKWQEQAIQNNINLIKQYRNHPSIILWGVRINESIDNHKLYMQTNMDARKLDPTRQTGGVRCYQKGEELEDVYTYNDFISPLEKRGLSKKRDIVKSKKMPYFVSECNGHMFPTKSFDDEIHRQEHLKRYARVLNQMYQDKEILGLFGWCMFDYNTHKDFGSGDKICYHGVLDMFRNFKLPAYLYQSFGDEMVLKLSSTMNLGEHPAGIINGVYAITNAESIRLYKNDEFIREYTRKDSPYSSLKNPPILIDDFIGELLVKHEGFSEKVSNQGKEVLYAVLKYGRRLPLRNILQFLKLMIFNKMTIQKGYELYGKYIGNWGSKDTTYRFEAIKDNIVVKTINLSSVTKLDLDVKVSSSILKEDTTYDVSSIRLMVVDQNNNHVPYYQEPIELKVEGPLELIGPSVISFKGGMSGTYVKTIGKKGKAKLIIKTQFVEKIVNFEIK